ncbi:hypothetical protein [Curvibacter sp. CHRR-16]|uniref:hypothetical protein n=1 Tax=Curvibacter sp. CHRR-16 TaxID=2835872 RepID=UPI002023B520|nr:hypothetical protein [Curvibacter sp. CHRR-16]
MHALRLKQQIKKRQCKKGFDGAGVGALLSGQEMQWRTCLGDCLGIAKAHKKSVAEVKNRKYRPASFYLPLICANN